MTYTLLPDRVHAAGTSSHWVLQVVISGTLILTTAYADALDVAISRTDKDHFKGMYFMSEFSIALVIAGLYLLFRIFVAKYSKSFLDILFVIWMAGGILIALVRRQFPSVVLDNVGMVYFIVGILVLVVYPVTRKLLDRLR